MRMASGHPYGARNRSDRLTGNRVSARFPHPALRATFPPGEGFLEVRGWKGMVGGVMTPPDGARRETKEGGWPMAILRGARVKGGRSVIAPTGAEERREAGGRLPPLRGEITN